MYKVKVRTVGELLEYLQQFSPDTEVFDDHTGMDWIELEFVSEHGDSDDEGRPIPDTLWVCSPTIKN